MVQDQYLFLLIWQSIVNIASIILLIIAFKRHNEKKSVITKNLVLVFLFTTIATLLLLIGNIFAYIDRFNDKFRIGSFLISYFVLMIGVFFLNRFAIFVFQQKNQKKIIQINKIVLILLIGYGIIQFFFDRSSWGFFVDLITSIDPYVLLYVFIITFTISIRCFQLMRKLDPDEEHYSKIRWILLTNIAFIVAMIFYVMITVYRMLTGQLPNVFSYLADLMTLSAEILAYLGFFRKK